MRGSKTDMIFEPIMAVRMWTKQIRVSVAFVNFWSIFTTHFHWNRSFHFIWNPEALFTWWQVDNKRQVIKLNKTKNVIKLNVQWCPLHSFAELHFILQSLSSSDERRENLIWLNFQVLCNGQSILFDALTDAHHASVYLLRAHWRPRFTAKLRGNAGPIDLSIHLHRPNGISNTKQVVASTTESDDLLFNIKLSTFTILCIQFSFSLVVRVQFRLPLHPSSSCAYNYISHSFPFGLDTCFVSLILSTLCVTEKLYSIKIQRARENDYNNEQGEMCRRQRIEDTHHFTVKHGVICPNRHRIAAQNSQPWPNDNNYCTSEAN